MAAARTAERQRKAWRKEGVNKAHCDLSQLADSSYLHVGVIVLSG